MPRFNTPQTRLPDYRKAKPLFWKRIYTNGGKALYSREAFAAKSKSWINIEHVFPMSWVMNNIGCGDRNQCRRHSAAFNQIEADMHNMYPARRDLNHERGSLSFGMIHGEEREFRHYDFEVDFQRRVIEPTLESRGNIARAMIYMADAYGLRIFNKQFEVLKNWNELDPPSEREVLRNDLIESVQGNRNHFIDYPKDVRAL
jgi:deoxyribonuclease-1